MTTTRLSLFVGGAVRRWREIGFAVFCLLAGSRWLVENAYPIALPPLLGRSFHFGVIGLLGLAFWRPKRRPHPKYLWRIGLAGVLLFGVPALCAEWAGSQAGPALFTLIPLCVVVAVGATAPGQGSRRLRMPALLGAAGGLLVLPFSLPTTFSSAAIMGLVLVSVAMVATGSVWLHVLLRQVGLPTGVLVVCGVNAVVLALAGLWSEGTRIVGAGWIGEIVRAIIFDMPEVFLLLWLLRAMRPEQAAARSFLVPWVTVVEGLVLLRPGLDPRMGLGMALMLACGSALLFWKGDGEEDATAPLGLSE